MSDLNMGECYYCHKPVWAAEGQSIKHIILTNQKGVRKEFPTHKHCRVANSKT